MHTAPWAASSLFIPAQAQKFRQAGFEPAIEACGITVRFGIDLLIQMHLHKRIEPAAMIGLLRRHFTDQPEPAKALSICATTFEVGIDAAHRSPIGEIPPRVLGKRKKSPIFQMLDIVNSPLGTGALNGPSGDQKTPEIHEQ